MCGRSYQRVLPGDRVYSSSGWRWIARWRQYSLRRGTSGRAQLQRQPRGRAANMNISSVLPSVAPVATQYPRSSIRLPMMSSGSCVHCRYIHTPSQICPKRYFQIPLGLKDSEKNFGCIIVRYDTTNNELNSAIAEQYRRVVSRWTDRTRVYRLSTKLYIVSCWFQKRYDGR